MARLWNSNECYICANYILENIGNLQRAFRLTSEDTGRKVDSIARSYYNKNSTLGKYLNIRDVYDVVSLG